MCAPVEQLLGRECCVVADLSNSNLYRRAVDAARAVDLLTNERAQHRTRDVDEASDFGEVQGHTDLNEVAGWLCGTVVEVCSEDGVDVEPAGCCRSGFVTFVFHGFIFAVVAGYLVGNVIDYICGCLSSAATRGGD